jgi:hypothetical protein
MKRVQPALERCYEEQLLVNPDLAGKATVRFDILASGGVAAAKASGVSAEVDACVTKALATLAFPAPGDGAVVSVSSSITFMPRSP